MKLFSIQIMITLIFIISLMKVCSEKEKSLHNIHKTLSIWEDSVSYYRDKTDQLITEKKVVQMSANEFSKTAERLRIDKESLESQVGKLKNLVSFYKGNVVSEGIGEIVLRDTIVMVEIGDSVFLKNFDWNNNFLFLKGTILNNDMNFEYSYTVDFELVSYWKKRKGFLSSKKELVVDLKLKDPYAKSTQLNGVIITKKKKWFETTGAQIGLGLLGGFILKERLNK